jgi:hypothetical protein
MFWSILPSSGVKGYVKIALNSIQMEKSSDFNAILT